MQKILYIDMDGVLVDFESGLDQVDQKTKEQYKGRLDEIPNIFSLMQPVENAIESFNELSN
ncbi:MAG TPA: 2-C-methyl-D-erythritol 4-phosphate cytidylyltransferase, partial [Tenuifilaceae bacterium]|nr:2-C-methyl-D-erythritol 4-phosphate cytidylyltransferase [Tenuifilaceae bacterium]